LEPELVPDREPVPEAEPVTEPDCEVEVTVTPKPVELDDDEPLATEVDVVTVTTDEPPEDATELVETEELLVIGPPM